MNTGFFNEGWMGGWYGMMGGPIMMLLFLAAFIALIVFIVRAFSSGNGSTPATAREMLEQRFARGEISTDEFEEAKKALRN